MPPAAHEPVRGTPSSFTARHFRDALAQFATGVTVIAAAARTQVRGVHGQFLQFGVARSAAHRLEPRRASETMTAFQQAERYAVNVLAHDQVELARRFRAHADRFAGVPYRLGVAGAPLIEGASPGSSAAITLQPARRPHAVHREVEQLRAAWRRRARIPPRPLRDDRR